MRGRVRKSKKRKEELTVQDNERECKKGLEEERKCLTVQDNERECKKEQEEEWKCVKVQDK